MGDCPQHGPGCNVSHFIFEPRDFYPCGINAPEATLDELLDKLIDAAQRIANQRGGYDSDAFQMGYVLPHIRRLRGK